MALAAFVIAIAVVVLSLWHWLGKSLDKKLDREWKRGSKIWPQR